MFCGLEVIRKGAERIVEVLTKSLKRSGKSTLLPHNCAECNSALPHVASISFEQYWRAGGLQIQFPV